MKSIDNNYSGFKKKYTRFKKLAIIIYKIKKKSNIYLGVNVKIYASNNH